VTRVLEAMKKAAPKCDSTRPAHERMFGKVVESPQRRRRRYPRARGAAKVRALIT
jgi:hypothetical protein